jgi:hypothetical protein
MAFLLSVLSCGRLHPTTYTFGGTPAPFAACRYAGQAGSLRRVVNPPVLVISDNASAGLQPQPAGCLTEKEHVHTVKGLG